MGLLAFAGAAIQLVPDGTLLFHLVLIGVMVSLLNASLLKPINRVLEERERLTKGRFGEVRKVLGSAEEKAREYEQRLREARASGYALLDDERNAASREQKRQVAIVKADVTRWVEREKQSLRSDEVAARANIIKDVRQRASEISVRILGRPIASLQ